MARGQSGAGGQRNSAAHNAVGAQEAAADVGHVHRAAPAPAETALFAEQLCHDMVHIAAFHHAVAVAAMADGDVVAGVQSHVGAGDSALLAQTDMYVSLDLAL